MINLQSEDHYVRVLEAVQKKTKNGCEIVLCGVGNSRYQSNSLWILSPLVRSIIDSLRDIRDNLIVLPDFSSEDIKNILEITEGKKREDVTFNCNTKHLLETLGIDLKNSYSQPLNLEISTDVDELLDSSVEDQEDEDEDYVKNRFLIENPESDDEEETEHSDELPSMAKQYEETDIDSDIIQDEDDRFDNDESDDDDVTGDTSSVNIKVEETDLHEINIENIDDNEDGDGDNMENEDDYDDLQSQLLMDQDLSDSEDESFEENEVNLDQSKVVQQMLEDRFIQELLEEDDSTNETPEEEVSDTEENSHDENQTGQTETENVPKMKENKCNQEILEEGDSTNENLVEEGLDTGENRTENIQKLVENKFIQDLLNEADEIASTVEENYETEENSEDKNLDYQHQQKLMEVEDLLIRENGGWKCKTCRKIFRKRYDLRSHVEIHVMGLSYSCSHCNERFTTRERLRRHKQSKHRNIVKKKYENSQQGTLKVVENESLEFKELKSPNPEKIIDLVHHQQKLKEVEELLLEENGRWKCKECSKTLSSKLDLRKHAEKHVSGLSFPCKMCSLIFGTRNQLAAHMKFKHKSI